MKFEVFYRDSLRDSYDQDPPKVSGVAFKHVATVEVSASHLHSTTEVLETLYRVMNVVDGQPCEIPPKIKNRSMSVGDVAVAPEGAYVVCGCGWAACESPGEPKGDAPTFQVGS